MLTSRRFWADALTASRFLFGLGMVFLGLAQGTSALGLVVVLVVISWLTDVADGILARSVPNSLPGWIGRHDAEADLSTSLGVAGYLMISGFLNLWLGTLLLVVILSVWFLHSRQLAWPFYAIPYLLLLGQTMRQDLVIGWAIIVYLVVILVVRWPRLRQEYLQELRQALDSIGLRVHR